MVACRRDVWKVRQAHQGVCQLTHFGDDVDEIVFGAGKFPDMAYLSAQVTDLTVESHLHSLCVQALASSLPLQA